MEYKIPVKICADNTFTSEAILRIVGASPRGGPGGWSVVGKSRLAPEGSLARFIGLGRVRSYGPRIEGGPHLYGEGQVVVWESTEGVHERAADKGLLFDIKEGDILVIDGTAYILIIDQLQPALVLVL